MERHEDIRTSWFYRGEFLSVGKLSGRVYINPGWEPQQPQLYGSSPEAVEAIVDALLDL